MHACINSIECHVIANPNIQKKGQLSMAAFGGRNAFNSAFLSHTLQGF
jgi:hypothetical protein